MLSLATQQGDISVTFPGAGTWSYVWPTQLGGFMGSAPPYTAIPEPAVAQSGEFSPMGELVWACNTRAVHVSAGSRGTALLVQYGLVEVVNRRGDVLWKVSDKLDNPRWACMIDEDTVLIACKKDIQVHHRNTGLLSRVAGFESVSWVRYHPQKPWMVFDGGSQSIVFYNSETKERNIVRVGWTNDDPAYWSKWMPKSQRVPE